MPKTCLTDNCNNPIFSHKFCKYCQHNRKDDKWLTTLEKRKSVTTGLKSTKNTKIKSVSNKKLEELKQYRILRDEYMSNHTICEVKDCNRLAEDLHHSKNRAYYLCDVSVFKAVCRLCHTRIHSEDKWARDNGYLESSI